MHLASMPRDQYFCWKCLPNVGTHIWRYPKVSIELGFISRRNSFHFFHSSWLARRARKNLSPKEDKIFCQSLVAHNKSGSIKIYENEIEWAKFVVSNLPSFLEIEKQIYSLIFFVLWVWFGKAHTPFILLYVQFWYDLSSAELSTGLSAHFWLDIGRIRLSISNFGRIFGKIGFSPFSSSHNFETSAIDIEISFRF